MRRDKGTVRPQERDLAICIPVYTRNHPEWWWYVIEEDVAGDKATELFLPRLPPVVLPVYDEMLCNSLVVLNSRLYLLGGDDRERSESCEKSKISTSLEFRYWDLRKQDQGRWVEGGDLCCDLDWAVARDDGWVYTGGDSSGEFYLVNLNNGSTKLLPSLPRNLDRSPCILGVSKKKKQLFVYTPIYTPICGESESESDGVIEFESNGGMLMCYDPESNKWDVLLDVDECMGKWSTGLVLYEDRYLFAYGCPRDSAQYGIGIYVLDIERHKWLSTPVQGLDKVLPPEEGHFSYLLNIRDDDDHPKLALGWVLPCPLAVELHWSKFTLSNSTREGEEEAAFSAQVVSISSHGVPVKYKNHRNRIKVCRCIAGLEIGPDKWAKDVDQSNDDDRCTTDSGTNDRI
ncbi:hypothetical protein M0R45_037666 [Rubus argutus]|uniref:Uncharacterized protein n=1 Tax=Rubus argutus TaxID=59490 RepID=A0AAW1W103_RUBAR